MLADSLFDSAEGIGVTRRSWNTLIRYGIGLALLAFVIWRHWEPAEGSTGVGLKDVFRADRDIRWWLYGLAACVSCVNIAITFIRWYLLVRAQDLPFTLRDAFRLGLVGYFFNTFLPGAVGGDLLKAAFLAREQERRTVAVSTVLIDRGIGLWGLIALAAISGTIFWLVNPEVIDSQPDLRRAVRVALGLMAATFGLWAFLGVLPERRAKRFAERLRWLPRVGPVLAEFWRAVWLYRSRGFTIMTALGMSVLGHVCNVIVFFLAAQTFHSANVLDPTPSLFQHGIIVPVGMTFQGFFPAPGGVGGGEFIFGLLYERLGYPGENGILGSLGVRMLAWALGLCGYIVYMFMKRQVPAGVNYSDAPPPNDPTGRT